MTILSCQKRHHEPHFVWDVDSPFGGWTPCLGRAVWPYARPKPPSVHDHDRSILYSLEHEVIVVFKDVYKPLWTAYMPGDNGYSQFFTHAEAIAYAQDLVNERRAQDGLVQGG